MNFLVVALRPNGHRGTAGDDHLWWCTPATTQTQASDANPEKQNNQRMRNLTLVVMWCLKRSGMVGVEGIARISGELLQKGTHR
jgi:hypothetical protein